MNPTDEHAQIERLARDYRRLSLIYGVSIISLSLVITAMVWITPSFELFPTHPSRALNPTDFTAASAHPVTASTTP